MGLRMLNHTKKRKKKINSLRETIRTIDPCLQKKNVFTCTMNVTM